MARIVKIWRETFGIFRKKAWVFLPFCIAGLINSAVLYLLYLAPHRPVIKFLGPPIRAFFGAKFLHYPFNFYLLPKLYYYSSILLNATVGIVMTAFAIGVLKDVYAGMPARVGAKLWIAVKRYFALLGIWIIVLGLAFFFIKLMKLTNADQRFPQAFPYLTYGILLCIQIIFVYAIPVLIIQGKGFFSAIKEDCSM